MTAIGTQLKTKTGPSQTTTEYYTMYRTVGAGLGVIGKVAENTVVGTYQGTTTRSGKNYTLIQLMTPLLVSGVTYSTVYIETQWLFATAGSTPYYCTASSLNLRSSASAASTSNIVATVKKDALVGVSDGNESNGFLYLKRPSGQYVYASKSYLTTKNPSTGSAPESSQTSDGSLTAAPDPQADKSVIHTTLENVVGTQNVNWVKYSIIGIIVLVAVVSIVRIWRKK